MTTKTKVQFDQQSKCVTATTSIESDVMTPAEVLEQSKLLMAKALKDSADFTILMNR